MTRSPETIGEYVAAEMAQKAGCAEKLLVPPSQECPAYVHWAWGMAGWHVLTIVMVVFMLGFLVSFTLQDKKM